jgi:hypothetical protein
MPLFFIGDSMLVYAAIIWLTINSRHYVLGAVLCIAASVFNYIHRQYIKSVQAKKLQELMAKITPQSVGG